MHLTTIRVFRRGTNSRFVMVLPAFEFTGGNYITLTASVSDTFGNTLSPVKCSFVLTSVTCVKLTKVACFKMVARREGLDLEDFSDSGFEENIVDSRKEFVPADL